MTKSELVSMLLTDDSPADANVNIFLQCTNNDECILATLTGVMSGKKSMSLTGDYEEH